MKTLLSSLAAIAACAALAPAARPAQEWQQQSPIPAESHVQPRLGFLDAQRGYMVGLGETPLETTDGGLTWHPASIPGSHHSEIFVLDSTRAWVVGSQGTARTVDGGQTWESLPYVGLPNRMKFLSPSFGWMSSNYAAAVTHDGGLSWHVTIVNSSTRVRYPDFRDAQVGIGAEDDSSAIWRTTDGGFTWQEVYSAPVSSVAFLSPSVAIATGGGQLHRSTDAGATWQTLAAGASGARILVLDSQRALIYGGNGWSRTSDGGQTWTGGGWALGSNAYVTQVVRRSGPDLFALDSDGNIFASPDYGATWSKVRQGTWVGLNDAEFLPGGRAVAAGRAYILASDDDGATWREVSSGTYANVYDLAMWDSQRGLFCGEHAAVCTTEDGGALWSNRRPAWEFLGMNDAEAVDVVAPDFGIVVGEAGAPIVTRDGGRTWALLPSFTSSHSLQSVDFVTDQLGWVGSVGPTAWILRTSDGGQSWEIQYGPTYGSVRAIHMVDASAGYAIGGGALLLKTTNGGQSWIQSSLPLSQGAIDLGFSDAQRGWVVGDFGTILRTTDGGATWQDQSVDPGLHLIHVEVMGPDEAYATGQPNALLHTTDGGATWTPIPVPAPDPDQVWYVVRVGADGALWLGGAYGVVMHLPGDGFGTYCTAKTSSFGCVPSISATGSPGPNAGAPFVVTAADVPSRKSGLCFYGLNGPAAAPFQGGTLCVSPPLTRTAVQSSGGNFPTDCSGTFALDFDARIAAGTDARLVPGITVNAQFWFRDPGDPFGTGLSDGIEFLIQP